MNCYLHALDYMAVPAVAICPNCGVAMCLDHVAELQSHRPGGMQIGCPHRLPSPRDVSVSRRELRGPSEYS